MLDMIFALVLMLAVVAAAELVRVTCRRQLTAPAAFTRAPIDEPAELVGEQVAA